MKKVLIIAMICITLVVCTFMVACTVKPGVWDGTVATGFESGSGTENDPYMIMTGEQLALLAKLTNEGATDSDGELYSTKAYKLGADITLNDEPFELVLATGLAKILNGTNEEFLDTYKGEITSWTPIGKYAAVPYEITDSSTFNLAEQKYGTLYYYDNGGYYDSTSYNSSYSQYYYTASFKGSFDGDGHKISGVLINANEEYQGLFGYVENGKISNVTIENSYIRGGSFVGGIAGYCKNTDYGTITITNCKNSGAVSGGGRYVGGIVGGCYYGTTITISACKNSGAVSGNGEHVGGIAGGCLSGTTITNCVNDGDVSGKVWVGGIAGAGYGTITNCENSGAVSGSRYVGGIMGYCNDGTISDCANSGAVSGSYDVGGIAGYYSNYDDTTTISNCVNSGDVSGSYDVGGIVGGCWNDTISNCANSGDVNGKDSNGYSHVGGIAGVCNGTITNCVNSGAVSGSGNVSVGAIAGYCYGIEDYKTTIEKCYSVGAVTVNGTPKDIAIGSINATDNIVRSRQVYILDTSAADDITNVGTLLTDEQIREQSSFAGFDFDTVWTMAGDTSYPYPELQVLVK